MKSFLTKKLYEYATYRRLLHTTYLFMTILFMYPLMDANGYFLQSEEGLRGSHHQLRMAINIILPPGQGLTLNFCSYRVVVICCMCLTLPK